MHLLFQIQSLQLSIFGMNDQKLVVNLDYTLLCVFLCNIIKVNSFLYSFVMLLHTIPMLVPYAYVSIASIDCIIFFLSFEPKTTL